jgi:hypothetical protein
MDPMPPHLFRVFDHSNEVLIDFLAFEALNSMSAVCRELRVLTSCENFNLWSDRCRRAWPHVAAAVPNLIGREFYFRFFERYSITEITEPLSSPAVGLEGPGWCGMARFTVLALVNNQHALTLRYDAAEMRACWTTAQPETSEAVVALPRIFDHNAVPVGHGPFQVVCIDNQTLACVVLIENAAMDDIEYNQDGKSESESDKTSDDLATSGVDFRAPVEVDPEEHMFYVDMVVRPQPASIRILNLELVPANSESNDLWTSESADLLRRLCEAGQRSIPRAAAVPQGTFEGIFPGPFSLESPGNDLVT